MHNMICDTDPFMDTDMKQQITVGMGSHGIRQSQAWQEQAGVSRYIVTAVVAILYSKCIGPIVNQVFGSSIHDTRLKYLCTIPGCRGIGTTLTKLGKAKTAWLWIREICPTASKMSVQFRPIPIYVLGGIAIFVDDILMYGGSGPNVPERNLSSLWKMLDPPLA